jgi:F0F1-type ATP synthase assembly protein I
MAKGMSQASWGLSVAFGFVGVVLVFWLGGRFLDDRLGTDPWLQVVGAVIGWVLGAVTVYYMAQQDPERRGRKPR